MRRKRKCYFPGYPEDPPPISITVNRRIAFNEADPMGIAWHGRYVQYFEHASAELRRQCGFSYEDFFKAGLYAPVVQLHIDYHEPALLDENISITASMVWTESARVNIEYSLHRENGNLATSGYTVQMFTDSGTGEPCIVSPEIQLQCRRRWIAGDFKHMQ